MDSKLILEAARGTLDGPVRAGLATGSPASVAVCKDRSPNITAAQVISRLQLLR